MGFITEHGGLIAVVVLFLAIYNIVMSALASIFSKLGKAEPSALQSAAAWGLKVTQWLSANTPTPAAPATTSSTTSTTSNS